MLVGGALRRHVLVSCSLLRTYACYNSVTKPAQCNPTLSHRRSLANLSWQVQHAKVGAAQPGLGHVVRHQNHRNRSIGKSPVSCNASQPKTVRDIVRELKKGEP